ncbi:MAG: hypothetical protein Q4C10_10460, partial [Clostridia bacterium]|nr:hypothetical protein [Clostridia bacterium]
FLLYLFLGYNPTTFREEPLFEPRMPAARRLWLCPGSQFLFPVVIFVPGLDNTTGLMLQLTRNKCKRHKIIIDFEKGENTLGEEAFEPNESAIGG